MKVQNATCPPAVVLADFGQGKLDAASAETISQHLKTCTDCCERMGLFTQVASWQLNNGRKHVI